MIFLPVNQKTSLLISSVSRIKYKADFRINLELFVLIYSSQPYLTMSGPIPTQSSLEEPTYTTKQLLAVRRILECKDPYEILGVTKESSDSEIDKAYKKLSLKVHPDKNKAPGSLDAFQSLNNAKDTLIDAEKRKHYDLYGEETQGPPQHVYQYDTDMQAFILVGLGVAGVAVGVAAGMWFYNKFVKSSEDSDSDGEDRKKRKDSSPISSFEML